MQAGKACDLKEKLLLWRKDRKTKSRIVMKFGHKNDDFTEKNADSNKKDGCARLDHETTEGFDNVVDERNRPVDDLPVEDLHGNVLLKNVNMLNTAQFDFDCHNFVLKSYFITEDSLIGRTTSTCNSSSIGYKINDAEHTTDQESSTNHFPSAMFSNQSESVSSSSATSVYPIVSSVSMPSGISSTFTNYETNQKDNLYSSIELESRSEFLNIFDSESVQDESLDDLFICLASDPQSAAFKEGDRKYDCGDKMKLSNEFDDFSVEEDDGDERKTLRSVASGVSQDDTTIEFINALEGNLCGVQSLEAEAEDGDASSDVCILLNFEEEPVAISEECGHFSCRTLLNIEGIPQEPKIDSEISKICSKRGFIEGEFGSCFSPSTDNVCLMLRRSINPCIPRPEYNGPASFTECCVETKYEHNCKILVSSFAQETLKTSGNEGRVQKIIKRKSPKLLQLKMDQAIQTEILGDVMFVQDSQTVGDDDLCTANNYLQSEESSLIAASERGEPSNGNAEFQQGRDSIGRSRLGSENEDKLERLERFLGGLHSLPPSSLKTSGQSTSHMDADTNTPHDSLETTRSDSTNNLAMVDLSLPSQEKLEKWRLEKLAELERRKQEMIDQCQIEMERLDIEHEEEELRFRQKMLMKRKRAFLKKKKLAVSPIRCCDHISSFVASNVHTNICMQQQQNFHNNDDDISINEMQESRDGSANHSVLSSRRSSRSVDPVSCKASSPKRERKRFVKGGDVPRPHHLPRQGSPFFAGESEDSWTLDVPENKVIAMDSMALKCIADDNAMSSAIHRVEMFAGDAKRKAAFNTLCLKLGQCIRGYIVRRLLRSYRVQQIIKTLLDTSKECAVIRSKMGKCTEHSCDDVLFSKVLDKQITSAYEALHVIFFRLPSKEQMEIIASQRALEQAQIYKLRRISEGKQISAATKKVMERRNRNCESQSVSHSTSATLSNQSKASVTVSDQSKASATISDQSKANVTISNQSKASATISNQSKASVTVSNQSKAYVSKSERLLPDESVDKNRLRAERMNECPSKEADLKHRLNNKSKKYDPARSRKLPGFKNAPVSISHAKSKSSGVQQNWRH